MQNRNFEYQMLKQQNFQLKNQITDLKNGFDLNRDVLKILEDQMKEKNPKCHLFYQIISRLTGINNQIMITNMDLLMQKNKILVQKKKLEFSLEQVKQKNKQLLTHKVEYPQPKQVQMSLTEQINGLTKQIVSLNEQNFHKNMQIQHLRQSLKQKQIAEQKKPIIPTAKHSNTGNYQNDKPEIIMKKKYENNDEIRYFALNRQLKRENKELKRIVQELEYRLTLLARIYEIEPQSSKRQLKKQQQKKFKKLTQNQLSLLLFAFNNTQLSQDEQNETIKLTITKRLQFPKQQVQKQEQNLQSHNVKRQRVKSCIHKFNTQIYI